jgi:hypothetical protein
MSERDLIEGLNDSLSIDDLMRVPESQGIIEQDARLARLRGEPGSQERSIRAPDLDGEPRQDVFSGKGSWYSQLPQYGWVDREDRPGSNALGVKDENQGIALPSRSTLGRWFDVTFPDGTTHRLQQTDVGPAKWTGKGIDISAAAAHQAGYSPKNFPTGGNFTWKPAEGESSYDTEDRTAAGIGGSRSNPEVMTMPDPSLTGRRQMPDQEPRGIMDLLLGRTGQPAQGQAPQGGLLGMLGDPETMAYMAMIAKGASPYSNLDPNAMLSNAQTLAMRREALRQQQMEHALDNKRADAQLKLNQDKFADSLISDAAKAAKDQGFEPGTPEYKQYITDYYRKKTAVQHSLTPIRGEGGKLGTIDAAGNFKVIDTGDFKPEGPTTTRDLGTTIGVFDRAGNLISQTPKDIAGAAQQKEIGTQTGKAQVGLQEGLRQADQTIKELDELVTHPGRETGTGLSSKLDPRNYIPGTDAYNFAVRAKQLEGRAFLQAYETLKGTGQVTEIEGQKATQAIARMDRAQSDTEYLQALNDFKEVVNSVKTTLKQKASMTTSSGGGGNATRDALKNKYGLE